eukprot:TRINITY_DN43957_c0_g1_i1.p1 TRINITY_DN43957_c0_g1~~TRINITY_DN43957_c0_g1_i1.p1  ORF type:complete len:197 (+),score=60.68 TRINITY_DN43957_c0_g1_i1:56-646(+)
MSLHYATLGAPRGCSQEELKRAFRREALRWHPDKHLSAGKEEQEAAASRFRAAHAAYAVLGDPDKRRVYDTVKDDFPIGSQVRLQGLTTRADLNGLCGRVVGHDPADADRLQQQLDEGASPGVRIRVRVPGLDGEKSVRVENLDPIAASSRREPKLAATSTMHRCSQCGAARASAAALEMHLQAKHGAPAQEAGDL